MFLGALLETIRADWEGLVPDMEGFQLIFVDGIFVSQLGVSLTRPAVGDPLKPLHSAHRHLRQAQHVFELNLEHSMVRKYCVLAATAHHSSTFPVYDLALITHAYRP